MDFVVQRTFHFFERFGVDVKLEDGTSIVEVALVLLVVRWVTVRSFIPLPLSIDYHAALPQGYDQLVGDSLGSHGKTNYYL
jgi:hypothetical protein